MDEVWDPEQSSKVLALVKQFGEEDSMQHGSESTGSLPGSILKDKYTGIVVVSSWWLSLILAVITRARSPLYSVYANLVFF